MKTLASLLAISLIAASARADFATATFEDVATGANGYAIDYRTTGSFMSGGFTFNNDYTPPSPPFDGYFSGFGVSTLVDNQLVNAPGTSEDFDHQYGAYAAASPGAGSGGSATYGLVYNYFVGNAVIDLPTGFDPASIDVANTTYVASSIKYGDAFSRAFASGDYLRLDILGFTGAGGAGTEVGLVSIYLADARSGTLDLLDHFLTVDLASLAGSSSLAFALDSNVTNSFGISVPQEFAVDNVLAVRAVPEPGSLALGVIGAIGLWAVRRRRKA